MSKRHRVKYVHEGRYAAEVNVDLFEDETEWSPYLSIENAYNLKDVRDARWRNPQCHRQPLRRSLVCRHPDGTGVVCFAA